MVKMVTRVTRQSQAQLGRFVRAPGGCSALTDYGLWEPFARFVRSLGTTPLPAIAPFTFTHSAPGIRQAARASRQRY